MLRPAARLHAAAFATFTGLGLFLAALPVVVTDELGGSKAVAGFAVTSFFLSAIVLRPVVGRLIDRHGRRPFLRGATALLVVTAAGYLLAGSVAAVLVLRVLQGAGGSTAYTAAATTATDLAPPERRAGAIARLSLFQYGGFALGPALGELILETGSSDLVWVAGSALSAVGLALVWTLPETRTPPAADAPPMAPARWRPVHPAVVPPGLVLLTTGLGFSSITAFSSLYAREVGLDAAGLLYAAFAASVILSRLVSGTLADRVGHLAVARPGLGLAVAGLATLALLPSPATAVVGVAVFGTGFAFVFPALLAYATTRVPDEERGEGVGSFMSFLDLGQAAAGYVVGAAADLLGFRRGYGVPALACLAGLLLSTRLPPGAPSRVAATADSPADVPS